MAPTDFVGHAQLCAIAKRLYRPGMLDSDWVAALKDTLTKEGYRWETPESISRAILAVSAAHGRQDAPKRQEQPEPERAPFTPEVAKRLHDEWHAPPSDELLELARQAVELHPGTVWQRCHVQLKAMESAAIAAEIPFTWSRLSVALIKAQRELVLRDRARNTPKTAHDDRRHAIDGPTMGR